MNKITKKAIKRIKAGFHDDLIDAIEFLIDTYDEDKFDAGYRSCLDDLSVRSWRLAEHMANHYSEKGIPLRHTGDNYDRAMDTDDLAKVIVGYYTEALKQK